MVMVSVTKVKEEEEGGEGEAEGEENSKEESRSTLQWIQPGISKRIGKSISKSKHLKGSGPSCFVYPLICLVN